jgi:hypothetical protein
MTSICGANIPGTARVLVQSPHLNLNTVDSVDAVDEEDQNEDEGNLHAIL